MDFVFNINRLLQMKRALYHLNNLTETYVVELELFSERFPLPQLCKENVKIAPRLHPVLDLAGERVSKLTEIFRGGGKPHVNDFIGFLL